MSYAILSSVNCWLLYSICTIDPADIIPVGTATLGDAINLSKVINLGNIGGLVFFVALIATLIAFINKKEKKTN